MIDGLIITELKKINNEKGSVYHGMRNTDVGYNGFKEIYFSCINEGVIKAWKMHKKMTLNLIVPVGEIRFNSIEVENGKIIKNRSEFTIGQSNYCRITVPPLIIFGFKGISSSVNMVLNIANYVHEDSECENISENSFQFK